MNDKDSHNDSLDSIADILSLSVSAYQKFVLNKEEGIVHLGYAWSTLGIVQMYFLLPPYGDPTSSCAIKLRDSLRKMEEIRDEITVQEQFNSVFYGVKMKITKQFS